MNHYDLAIIGGGPSGIMAAISAALEFKSIKKEKNFSLTNKSNKKYNSNLHNNNSLDFKIVIIEKNDSLAKKLLLTGGGRCNISNSSSVKDYVIAFSSKFIKPSLLNFNHDDLIKFFQSKGLYFKKEGNEIYPVTDDAESVLNVFKQYLNELNIDIIYKTDVNHIKKEGNIFHILSNFKNKHNSFSNSYFKKNDYLKKLDSSIKAKKNSYNYSTETNQNFKHISSNKVILACGGMAYPKTGSTGSGYVLSKLLGHDIVEISPALTSIGSENLDNKNLTGIKFENVSISFKKSYKNRKSNKKDKVQTNGDVLLTHSGISGPCVLNISESIIRNTLFESKYIFVDREKYEKLINSKDSTEENKFYIFESKNKFLFNPHLTIEIDFKPDLTEEYLKIKINDDIKSNPKTKTKNYLKFYLPNRFIDLFLERSLINGDKVLNQLSKTEKNHLTRNLKHFKIKIPYISKKAMLSSGGVNLKEINPKTLESKLVSGLYFTGELLDISAPTGGYNLQLAISTGFLAGLSVSRSL